MVYVWAQMPDIKAELNICPGLYCWGADPCKGLAQELLLLCLGVQTLELIKVWLKMWLGFLLGVAQGLL